MDAAAKDREAQDRDESTVLETVDDEELSPFWRDKWKLLEAELAQAKKELEMSERNQTEPDNNPDNAIASNHDDLTRRARPSPQQIEGTVEKNETSRRSSFLTTKLAIANRGPASKRSKPIDHVQRDAPH